MGKTKKAVQATVPVLNTTIIEVAQWERQIEELKAKVSAGKSAIKGAMVELGLQRHATADGHEALLIKNEVFTWDVDKLEVVLGGDFRKLCPRKPDGATLRAMLDCWLESSPDKAKALRACAKVSNTKSLAVRSPDADAVTQPAENVTSIKDVA